MKKIFLFSTILFLLFFFFSLFSSNKVLAACDPVACAAKGNPTYACTGSGSNCEQYTWGCRGTPLTCTFGPHLPNQAQNLCCPGGGTCSNGSCSTGVTCASQGGSCMPATVCSTTAGINVGTVNCTSGNICCVPPGGGGGGGLPVGDTPGKQPNPDCLYSGCNSDQGTSNLLERCNKDFCDTAVGPIPTSVQGAVSAIFSVLLSIIGGIAVLLIIISGYKLMTSQGNLEKVQGAKEQLAAAIVGLLFVIFSFVILQIIGITFLGLPGFGP